MTQGKAIIFSAPSGAGKTTIVRHLLGITDLKLTFSVSATTRTRRPYEIDGKDYYFISTEEFIARKDADAFVEWEEVYTNQYYGTLKSEIEKIWAEGRNVIFDLDVLGGLNLKKIFGDRALAVFVKPPSIESLRFRLRNRSTETAEKIAMGWHLDGKVSAVLGTHTHVQTADARILPNGTAYITDVGMTGPYDSVLGMQKEIALKRFILQTAHKYETATDDVRLCGANVVLDEQTGKALSIEPFMFPEPARKVG